jgi:hypothetical protein
MCTISIFFNDWLKPLKNIEIIYSDTFHYNQSYSFIITLVGYYASDITNII